MADRSRPLFIEALLDAGGRRLGALVAVGVVGGLVGAAYVSTLKLLMRVLYPTHWRTGPHLLVLVGVGLVVGLVVRVLGTPGDVELLVDNIHVLGGAEDISDLRSLIPVSLLCIAAGGALGPEAPLVQTTGSLGSWVAGRNRLGVDDRRILTITGMAAGFTVLFGAPLGSAIFALEILHRRGLEYYEALLPAVLGSLVGFAVYAGVTHLGLEPVWSFPVAGPLRVLDIGTAALAGVAGAAVAALFTFAATASRLLFRVVPPLVRPAAGGLLLGLVAFWSPYALTFGEAQVNPLVARHAAIGVFVVAAAAKLLGSTITFGSGWRGGFIIPLFLIGVALGRLGHLLVPGTDEVVLMAACMAAVNVGVTKTTIGSTLVVTEMAGLRLLPTTLIASVVALFLTSQVGLIHTQRDRGTTTG